MEKIKNNMQTDTLTLQNILYRYIKNTCYQYREKDFTLSSGKHSKHYFDLRLLTMNPDMSYMLLTSLDNIININNIYFSHAGGLTMGADPIVYLLSNAKLRFPLIVRKEAKTHGAGKLIEGIYNENDRVLLIEDVCTTGGSGMKAVKAFRDAKLICDTALCILDREEGATELFKENGITLYSLFKKYDFGIGD